MGGLAALLDLAGAGEDVLVDLEGLLRVEAEQLLGRGDLGVAEGRAVRLAGAARLGGRPGDDRVQAHEGGLGARLPALLEGREQGVDVLGVVGGAGRVVRAAPVDVDDLPAVGLVALGDVLAERDVGVVLDRDLVRVVDDGEVAELLVAGERGGLGRHALHAGRRRRRAPTRGGRRRSRPGLASGSSRPRWRRWAIAMPTAEARPEPSGPVVISTPVGVVHLGVTGRQRAPGAQRLEVLQLQAVAAEVELDVLGERGVPARQHEPVAAEPGRVGRVVRHDVLEEQVRHRRQAHRGAGVAVPGLLHGIGRQHAHGVDGPHVEVGPLRLPGDAAGRSPGSVPAVGFAAAAARGCRAHWGLSRGGSCTRWDGSAVHPSV